MNAAELFTKLGYEQIRQDDDYIIYSKPVNPNDVTKQVSFASQNETVKVYYEDDIGGTQYPSIDMPLFKAIQQQLRELRWLEISE